jgi:very-short-patch-repair endonuclease
LKTIEKEPLIALQPKTKALDILISEGWYHIPMETAPKRWPPKMMAFYQGAAFRDAERYRIRYFGEVGDIEIVPRKILFPGDDENHHKAERLYYRIEINNLQPRYKPILSYRPRRLVFIPTTWAKFENAEQINDLFDGSPLEDRLWNALKYISVLAERQWKIAMQGHNYYLDFAVFCKNGKLAIETDGYSYHYDSRNQIDYDTWRHNEIELDNWRLLYYTTKQVKEDWTPYLAQIQKVIDQLGGQEAPDQFRRKVSDRQGTYIIDGEEPL